MPVFSFTKTFHKKTYAAIDPTRSELSAAGKTVIVTGASSGSIGSIIATSFAKAGAPKIALLGRTEKALLETKAQIEESFPSTTVMVAIADVTDTESIGAAAHEVRVALGAWDVFVHSAGYLPEASTLTGADIDDWWKGFEVNVRFTQIFAKHYMTKCRPDSTLITLSSGLAHVPAHVVPGASSYSASKFAALRLNDFLAAQYPRLRVFAAHPGLIDTPMSRKNRESSGTLPTFDDPMLAGNFMVWLASAESEFLRTRFVSANWDVDELVAKKAALEEDPMLLKPTIGGWPFEYTIND